MCGICGDVTNRERHDFIELHGPITREAPMFRRNLSGLVGELPRRIGKNGRETATASETQEITWGGMLTFRASRRRQASVSVSLRHRRWLESRKRRLGILRHYRHQAAVIVSPSGSWSYQSSVPFRAD